MDDPDRESLPTWAALFERAPAGVTEADVREALSARRDDDA